MVVTDTPREAPPARTSSQARRRGWLAAALGVALAASGLAAWSLATPGPPGPPPASVGTTLDHRLPAAVLDTPLVDASGRAVTLGAWRGRVVVLVPFLTSCQEVCPLTTAALASLERDLAAAGLRQRVAVLEVSVDPQRDVPARLAAYAHLTGTRWPMLTGDPAAVSSLWRTLGVYAQRVPESSPPGIDWQTGRRYTYDVDHSDGFFLVDARGHERFVTLGTPNLQGRPLRAPLAAMLDARGRANQRRPGPGAWTVADARQAVGWLVGRPVPAAG